MIPFNDLSKNIDKQIYNATDGVTWETWDKPFGCTTAFIICIGGGGGGGAGAYRTTALAPSNSGGGGCSSAFTIAQVPFYVIPDTMYIRVALGGIPGTPNVISGGIGINGGTGGLSYVSFYPSISMADCLVTNSLTGAGGGQSPSSGAIGGSASAPPALVNSASGNPLYLSLCNWTSYAGTASIGPVSNANGTNSTICGSNILCGGPCGAGGGTSGTNTGGSIISADSLVSFFTTIAPASTGGTPKSGFSSVKPFFFTGGASSNATNGALSVNGGNGAIGCGGGGSGGPSGAGSSPGNGGYGGNGLVIIISF